MSEGKKVLVGMSGGVDSSAAALLLKERGFDVCGCTLILFGDCSDDIESARGVCGRLGIEHITADFSGEFESCVMKGFAEGYMKGETPNPCVECNRCIKFDKLLDIADEKGFDLIATGHYADIGRDGDEFTLLRPADRHKDQTYFLYTLDRRKLSRTLFPLGGYTKEQVRQLAAEKGFESSRRRDSQDICFVPDGDHGAFIERYTGFKSCEGDFTDTSGKTVGRHQGALRYTVGQRRGLGIAMGRPVYVTGKCMETNTVTVGGEDELYKMDIVLRNVSFISGIIPDAPVKAAAKVRYRGPDTEAEIFPPDSTGAVRVHFGKPVKAPAAGQSCVFYDGGRVLGGGVITDNKEAALNGE